jgi:acyl carrier protein
VDKILTVKQFIVDEFIPDVPVDELEADYDLIANGVIDSLGLLRVISWLENHYNIPIDDVEINEQDFVTVTAIVSFVERWSPDVSVAKAA